MHNLYYVLREWDKLLEPRIFRIFGTKIIDFGGKKVRGPGFHGQKKPSPPHIKTEGFTLFCLISFV